VRKSKKREKREIFDLFIKNCAEQTSLETGLFKENSAV
jgi:hypothetical protein